MNARGDVQSLLGHSCLLFAEQSLLRSSLASIAALLLLPMLTWAGGVVTNCTETALRSALVGGGLVNFACDGVITLSATITNDTDTVLDGSGHQVVVSGGGAVEVFFICSNVALTVVNLTIANGSNTIGGGIFNDAGALAMLGVTISGNKVLDRRAGQRSAEEFSTATASLTPAIAFFREIVARAATITTPPSAGP